MNLLYVDSDPDYIDEFKQAASELDGVTLNCSLSSEGAIEYKNNNLVDIFIISLNGLAINGGGGISLDESIELFRKIIDSAPLTPVYFLVSFDLNIDVINILLSASHHVDVWGDGAPIPTVKVFSKVSLQTLVDELSRQAESISVVDRIAIDSGGKNIFLKPEQKRLLRVFARQFGGASCRVSPLDGGLSGSRVLQLHVEDDSGSTRIYAVAKLDDANKIDNEVKNNTQEVSRLPVRAYASQVGVVKGGTSNSAGVFYRLLSSSDRPLYQLLTNEQERAAIAVNNLRQLLLTWHGSRPRDHVKIETIRKQMVTNENVSIIAQRYDLDWIQDVERITVNSCTSCIHGDLHGGNVFVSDNNEPVMIDFGDVCQGPSVFDPITLELSMFTHPGSKEFIEWFPDVSNIAWSDIDDYLVDCPYSDFIKACREWSHQVAGGDQAVNAGAYAYLLRQLKYSDVDPDIVLPLLLSVKESILNPV